MFWRADLLADVPREFWREFVSAFAEGDRVSEDHSRFGYMASPPPKPSNRIQYMNKSDSHSRTPRLVSIQVP